MMDHRNEYCELQNASTALAAMLARLSTDDMADLVLTGEMATLMEINQRLVKDTEALAVELLDDQITTVTESRAVDYWQLFECLDMKQRDSINILIDRLLSRVG